MEILRLRHEDASTDAPIEVECKRCGSLLRVERSDAHTGALGCAYVTCPVCMEEIEIDQDDWDKRITKDNLEFPRDFYRFCKKSGAKPIDDEQVVNDIRRGIESLRKSHGECYSTGSGDTSVFIQRMDGDEEYCVSVSKDTYAVEVPFEAEDY